MKKTHYFLFILSVLFLTSFVSAQWNQTFSNGLVGYWGFNEGSGITTADSLGLRNGTLINGTNGNVTWQPELACKNGDCLKFREVDYGSSNGYGFVNISNAQNLFFMDKPWAVSFWVYSDGSNANVISSDVSAESTRPVWFITIRNFGGKGLSPIMRRISGDGEGLNEWENNFLKNRWVHYVVTFDGVQINTTTLRMYRNGSLADNPEVYSDTCSAGNENNSYLSFGAGTTGNNAVYGYLDEIAIWNRSLSASEIQSLSTGIFYERENETGNESNPLDVPFVFLNSPTDKITTNNNLVTFNCSSIDEDGMSNLTLYINDLPFYSIANTTARQNLSFQIVVNLTNEGTYNWTCIARDVFNRESTNQAINTFTYSTYVPPTPSVTGSSISSIMSDFGAGIGIFILSILPALAVFLIILAFVVVIIIVAKEIKDSGFKSFTNGRVGVK